MEIRPAAIGTIIMLLTAFLLTILSVILRLAPHIPNAAPIGALALFLGAYYPKRWAWIFPCLAMLASDLFLGFYDARIMAAVYGSFIATFYIGGLLKEKNAFSIAAGTLAGSTFFFLTTNFAVWAFSNSYSKTIDGLLSCYALALPFFRNTVAGDMAYAALFFGGYAVGQYAYKHLKTRFGLTVYQYAENH